MIHAFKKISNIKVKANTIYTKLNGIQVLLGLTSCTPSAQATQFQPLNNCNCYSIAWKY